MTGAVVRVASLAALVTLSRVLMVGGSQDWAWLCRWLALYLGAVWLLEIE